MPIGLKNVIDRVVIKINIEGKNSWQFEDGTQIRYERQWNNLNRRETEPVNAIVISSEDIPEGTEILINPNAIHDSYRIFNYEPLSGSVTASDWKYYSIAEDMCYLYKNVIHIEKNGIWRPQEQWLPLKGYVIGQRVFKPYEGLIAGIEPSKIKDVLYIESGEFFGKVVHTLRACDYEIIFQGTNGKEQRIIRCRHFEDDADHEREEIIAINHDLTEKVQNGEYFIGLTASTAKSLKQLA